jgi:hypothetical protein
MQIIGGVRQVAAQWKHIEFAPVFLGDSGGCTVPTPAGPITAAWRREGAGAHVELALPRGITATVRLPDRPMFKTTGRQGWQLPLVRPA